MTTLPEIRRLQHKARNILILVREMKELNTDPNTENRLNTIENRTMALNNRLDTRAAQFT